MNVLHTPGTAPGTAPVTVPRLALSGGGLQNFGGDRTSVGNLMSVCALHDVHNQLVIAQSDRRLSPLLNVGPAPWLDCLAMEFAFTIHIDPSLRAHRIYDRDFDSFRITVHKLNSDVMWMDVISRSGHVWSPQKQHTTPAILYATIRCTTLDWEMLISRLNDVVTTLQCAS